MVSKKFGIFEGILLGLSLGFLAAALAATIGYRPMYKYTPKQNGRSIQIVDGKVYHTYIPAEDHSNGL